MKKTITMLGVIACACGISSLQAAPDQAASKKSAKSRHSTIYITSVTAVGSHIPLVVRAYNGSIISMTGVSTYDRSAISGTGSSQDVALALAERDPAISFGGRR